MSTAAPSLTGVAQAGLTVTASYGSWTGASPTSWGFQWERCDATGASCSAIAGATSRIYTVAVADIGSRMPSEK